LKACGHTLCLDCIRSLDNKCSQCGVEQQIDNFDELMINEKLVKIIKQIHNI
jgi:hypothetical protein